MGYAMKMKRLCMLLGLALTSSSTWLFSQVVYVVSPDTNSIAAFTMNASSGALTAVPGSPFQGDMPIQPVIDPSGKFLYVHSGITGFGGISAYAINAASGAL